MKKSDTAGDGERGLDEERARDQQGDHRDCGREHVGHERVAQHVDADHPLPRQAFREGGPDVVLLHRLDHGRADEPCDVTRGREAQREDRQGPRARQVSQPFGSRPQSTTRYWCSANTTKNTGSASSTLASDVPTRSASRPRFDPAQSPSAMPAWDGPRGRERHEGNGHGEGVQNHVADVQVPEDERRAELRA